MEFLKRLWYSVLMAKAVRSVRLPVALDERFSSFCRRTRRDEPETMRHIVDLFFADGDETAERRLSKGLWEPASPGDIAQLEAEIEDAVKRPVRKRKSG